MHKVVVTELKDDTFYAVIWLERGGEVISIDSRPIDALALALRVDCPIFVEETVLKTSKLAANVSDRVTSEELRKWLEGLNDEDLGKIQDVEANRIGSASYTTNPSGRPKAAVPGKLRQYPIS